MICPTCKIPCSYICPNCYESVSSSWHKSEDAKEFGKIMKEHPEYIKKYLKIDDDKSTNLNKKCNIFQKILKFLKAEK